jgi:hypothetical protein
VALTFSGVTDIEPSSIPIYSNESEVIYTEKSWRQLNLYGVNEIG